MNPDTLVQPYPLLRHLDVNHYPMCRANLLHHPGSALRQVSPAILDLRGSFPYLLFRLKHKASGLVINCVRGSASFLNDEAIEQLYTASFGVHFFVSVKGGGNMQFSKNYVQIFGASKTFGRADHHISGKLVKFCLPRIKVLFEQPALPPPIAVKLPQLTRSRSALTNKKAINPKDSVIRINLRV